MSSPIEEIKARLDIVDFIQSYVRLQKAGMNYRAICPFHAEKTPSFFVSPSRQIWHCFGGCGKGGDIFKFVMEIEGHDFPEALKLLALRAGVILRREDPSLRSERNLLYDICEEATKIFEKNLSLTQTVKTYLKKRGVADESISQFHIGFAPQSWDFLIKALGAKGFKTADLEKAGLAIRRGQTQTYTQTNADIPRESASSPRESALGWYDRFRSRIMFPITDLNGRVVGFSGRIFAPEARTQTNADSTNADTRGNLNEAKYVNTPQTLIYDKSRVLYGFNAAKQEIRTKNQVVVVEGQMDLVMSHQAGVKNTVAVSGTALTEYQLKILRRLCSTIICSFDVDAAGDSATKRSLELADQFEFERKIAVIPSGKDPADAILENPVLWQKAVEEAKSVIDFYFEKSFKENDPRSVSGKNKISSVLIPLISELSGEIEKAHWVGELSRRLGVPDDAVWNELRKKSHPTSLLKRGERGDLSGEEERKEKSRRDLLEERLLTLLALLNKDVVQSEFAGYDLKYISTGNQELYSVLVSFSTGQDAIAGAPHLAEKINLLKFRGEVMASTPHDLKEELKFCRSELEKECVKDELRRLGNEIAQKEKAGDFEKVAPLLSNFNELSNKLRIVK